MELIGFRKYIVFIAALLLPSLLFSAAPYRNGYIASTTTANGIFYNCGSIYNYNLKTDSSQNFTLIGGTITLSGTVDGRDIAADGVKLDNLVISSSAFSTDIAALKVSTGAIQTELDASQLSIGTATGTIQTSLTAVIASTGALQTELDASQLSIGTATGTLRTDLIATQIATGTLRTTLDEVGVATASLRTTLDSVGVDTASLRTDLDALQLSTFTVASIDHNLIQSTGTITHDAIETLLSTLQTDTTTLRTDLTETRIATGTLDTTKVPYSGATGYVDLGSYGIGTSSITFTDGTIMTSTSAFSGGGGGSGEVLVKTITQAGHSFTGGELVYFDGSDYALAQADDTDTAEVVGIVDSADGDDFDLIYGGYIDTLTSLSTGTVYFLSDSSAGDYTETEPTTIGYVSKPVFIAVSETEAYFFNMRGMEVTAESSLLTSTNTWTATQTFDDLNTSDDGIWRLIYSTRNITCASFTLSTASGTSALGGNVDKDYFIVFQSTFNVGADSANFYFNGDEDTNNYCSQRSLFAATYAQNSGNTCNYGIHGTVVGNTNLWITASSGNYRSITSQGYYSDTANTINGTANYGGYWENTADNITSIKIKPQTRTSMYIQNLEIWARR